MAKSSFRSTANFFDRAKVLKAVDRARLRIFDQFGRKVRSTAQKSLRYGKTPSSPGSPPTAHRTRTITKRSRSTGKTRRRSVSFLREFLFYSHDPATKSVVIGPEKLRSTASNTALPALEYGGTSAIVSGDKKRTATIAARPFMRPAAAAELPNLPPMWRDSVR